MKRLLTTCISVLISAVVFSQSASAETVTTVTTNQQFLVSADGSVKNDSTTQYLSVEQATLSYGDKSATAYNGGTSAELMDLLVAGDNQNDINDMLPNIDLGYLSTDSWYIEYVIKNTSEDTRLTITDYRISLYAMHYYESGHTAIDGDVVVLLTPGYMDDAHSYTQTEVKLTGSNTTQEAGVSHGAWSTNLNIPFTLDPGETIRLFATVAAPEHNDHADGHLYIGLEGFQLAGTATTPAVPEPTTATLSLLALAGLAARRRRK